MKLIKPSYEILTPINRDYILKFLESIGRVCYQSADKITDDSAARFVSKIISKNHESVIEHVSISVKFIVDRGFSHQLIRHRMCSFTQESTRFCNYSKNKFDEHVTFIIPLWYYKKINPGEYNNKDTRVNVCASSNWFDTMLTCEQMYLYALQLGESPEQARSLLPNSLKTEIICTANLREWRHIFKLRCNESSHPQMREIMVPLRNELISILPEIFEE